MMCAIARRTALAATAALAPVLLLAGCGSGSSGPAADADPAAPGSSVGTRLDRPLPQALLHLPLVDAAGQPRPLSAFRGKVLVISDTMTLCQETCPLDTASVVQTARAVEKAGLGDYVEFVSITIDPKRDTPAQLSAYRKLFAPPPADWITLTGPPAAINRLWNTLGVYRKKVPQDSPPPKNWRTGQTLTYDLDHSDEVFFVDDTYHDRFVLEGPPHVLGATVPAALRTFLDADGRQQLDHPAKSDWTVGQAEQVLSWLLGERV